MTDKPKNSRRRRKARPSAIEIREMRLDDLPAVFALGQKLFTAEDLPTLYRSWDDDVVMQLFSSDQETCLVAVADQKIVGFALGSIMENPATPGDTVGWSGWAWMPATTGMASPPLLNQLTSLFIRRHARILLVDTDEENHPALAFFRKNGFGHELRHVYLSQNLDTHPEAIERKETWRDDEED